MGYTEYELLDLRNAKDELLELLAENGKTLKAAAVEALNRYSKWPRTEWTHPIYLYEGYSKEDYTAFLNEMDFRYDDSDVHGPQNLSGVLWFTDGSHARRGIYDGLERWKVLDVLPIPKRGERLREPFWKYSLGGG